MPPHRNYSMLVSPNIAPLLLGLLLLFTTHRGEDVETTTQLYIPSGEEPSSETLLASAELSTTAGGKRSIYSCNIFLMLWTRQVAYTDSESAYTLILECLQHLASAINKHMFNGLDFTLWSTWIETIVHNRPLDTACSWAAITVKVYSTCSAKCIQRVLQSAYETLLCIAM